MDRTLIAVCLWISIDWVLNTDDFIRLAQEDADQFRPIGEKIHEYTKQDEEGMDEHYEIYKVSCARFCHTLHSLIV